MRSDLLATLNAERAGRRAVILLTDLATGVQRLVRAADIANDPLGEELEERLRSGKSGLLQAGATFALVKVPPVRLVVFGAAHIAQALAPMAKLAGFDLVIVDPRTAFATLERFPDCEVIAEWPQEVLPRLGLDLYTAMVLLTHEPRIDDPGITAALAAQCFYVGALGSRKTHANRLERLRAAGIAEPTLARIHAPIGLDIGAVSPAEIAISILAEIIAARRQKPLRSERAVGISGLPRPRRAGSPRSSWRPGEESGSRGRRWLPSSIENRSSGMSPKRHLLRARVPSWWSLAMPPQSRQRRSPASMLGLFMPSISMPACRGRCGPGLPPCRRAPPRRSFCWPICLASPPD